MCAESSFDELLNLVEMNDQLACDPEVGGCGKLNYIHHFLSTPPHVFMTGGSVVTRGMLFFLVVFLCACVFWGSSFSWPSAFLEFAVLGWQNSCESADDITATVEALSTEMDISVLYRGLDPKSTHSLVSVVSIWMILLYYLLNVNVLHVLFVVFVWEVRHTFCDRRGYMQRKTS